MRFVKGIYVNSFKVQHPSGDSIELHVWMNSETRSLVAVGNMDYVDANRNYVNDPYQDGVGIVFSETFSGLPV
jgi:hypothetical protein